MPAAPSTTSTVREADVLDRADAGDGVADAEVAADTSPVRSVRDRRRARPRSRSASRREQRSPSDRLRHRGRARRAEHVPHDERAAVGRCAAGGATPAGSEGRDARVGGRSQVHRLDERGDTRTANAAHTTATRGEPGPTDEDQRRRVKRGQHATSPTCFIKRACHARKPRRTLDVRAGDLAPPRRAHRAVKAAKLAAAAAV